jgi:hypothetical protein
MTAELWADGLDGSALAAVRRTSERGVPDADAALVELEWRGARSVVAREIVLSLAADLAPRSRGTPCERSSESAATGTPRAQFDGRGVSTAT